MPAVIQPTIGSGCPEIDALPEFLQDISRELFQQSRAEGHTEIFRDACKRLKEIIPESECPYRPYTIGWRLWLRGFTRGFTENYISTVVNEKITEAGRVRRDIARTMLSNGFDRNTVVKITGLTEDDLAQICH
jgi:hypothetical protein